jgi:hypothetical protein
MKNIIWSSPLILKEKQVNNFVDFLRIKKGLQSEALSSFLF